MIRHEKILPILLQTVMTILILFGAIHSAAANTVNVLPLQLNTQPSSSMMCKKIRPDQNIRIRIAKHRDIILRKVPNQFIPQLFEDARKKTFVHHLSLHDLTNGEIVQGAIAFDTKHAVIFTDEHPQGISREEFVAQMPAQLVPIANQTLNTFLRLHPILNAAIDGCRPYPSQVSYGTDDEFDKIQAGRMRYRDLATAYNAHPNPLNNFSGHERGISGGFYDPRTQGKRVSYQAANPLSFFRALPHQHGRYPR